MNDELSFLHFNDVYHITQPTVLGRLAHVFRKAKAVPEAERPITIFSGDAFSPSLESSVMKGEHMVPVLNHLLVDVACYGNHANAVHANGRLLATAKEYLVLEKRGYKIGFFGLAGTDWPSNCPHLPADCTILDPIPVAQRVSHTLRSTHNVDIVVAITHMRHEEDFLLAKSCQQQVDLILGGHDHDLTVHGASLTMINDTFEGNIKVIKSGTDFRNYSDIKMVVCRKNGIAVIERIRAKDIPDDGGIHEILAQLQTNIAAGVDKPLFYTAVPLEGRTSVIRTEETNIGNMVADAVRAYYNADIAFINSGSLRCDRIIEVGVVTVKDLIDVVPFDNNFVVKRLPGRTVAAALENAACDIIDGRFLQVSGITFSIDSHQPSGSRIHAVHLAPTHSYKAKVSPEHKVLLHDDKEYTVAMVAFIAEGFDGYSHFKSMPTVVCQEGGMTSLSLLMQVFRGNSSADELDIRHEDETDVLIDRARAAIVVSRTVHSLPLVNPSVQERIQYIRRHSL
ncbi:hypothetical protein PAXINDRAFT_178979 [Paxillus involutus ATCC 200175]|nr:hypothetical protein PAXINDRAFT_178979 [Paxillus involutus ATCC 200175]